MEQSNVSMFADVTVKNFDMFLVEHDSKMQTLRNQILENSSALFTSISPAVEIQYSNIESQKQSRVESEFFVNKTLTTLANICNQCHDLTKSAKQFQIAFLFAVANLQDIENKQGSADLTKKKECVLFQMSRSIYFFCQVYFLLKRMVVTLQNAWHQIIASISNKTAVVSKEVHVFSVFDSITELLEQLVVFNEIIDQSRQTVNWTLYKKWLQTIYSTIDVSKQGTNFELNGVFTTLEDFDEFISGNVYRIFLDGLQTQALRKQLNVDSTNQITQQSNDYVRHRLSNIEANQSNELKNYENQRQVIRLTAFISAAHELGIKLEAKLLKKSMGMLLKYQRLSVYENINLSPYTFLTKHAKSLSKFYDKLQDNSKQTFTYGEKFYLHDRKCCQQLWTEMTLWSIKLQRAFAFDVFDQLKGFSELVVTGQKLIDKINILTDRMINQRAALTVPITQEFVQILCKLIQCLKIFQQLVATNHFSFLQFLSLLMEWEKQKLHNLLFNAKEKMHDNKVLRRRLQVLSMLQLAERSLKCHSIKQRFTILNLSFTEFIAKSLSLPAEKQKYLKTILSRINNLIKFRNNMLSQFNSINLIYTYWSLSTLHGKECFEETNNAYALQNIFAATTQLDKTINVFRVSQSSSKEKHLPIPRKYTDVVHTLDNNIEMFLRLKALSHLLRNESQPFQETICDYRNCMSVSPIEMNGTYSILKDNIENYFSKTFYNLTTIVPHDWKSYEKMRHYAANLFTLRPVIDYLPSLKMDQGMDVLQIMRNIHTFACSYAYNMNLQLFVEHQSKSKYLDTIGTHHIANSVQTHGTGIINTTVNFIYQFLRQKFYTFSTFLHDEHIKSALLKESRYCAELRGSKKFQSYPYERAESFIKKIRKLGYSSSGETYMDLFRKVITQVGNAIGYIRLLQSGSKQANYRIRCYMPPTQGKSLHCEIAGLHKETETSLRAYTKYVEHVKDSPCIFTNYFELLMQGFQPFFCNPHNQHLQTFYLITPALIMNYIDYRVKETSKTFKKDQSTFLLFDDGFAIGLIFILSMLNQLNDFQELAWHDTIRLHLKTERAKMPAARPTQSALNNDEKLLQTAAIAEKHITSYENEYKLLFASLSSAEIFFQ